MGCTNSNPGYQSIYSRPPRVDILHFGNCTPLHCQGDGVKHTAGPTCIWMELRRWGRLKPPRSSPPSEGVSGMPRLPLLVTAAAAPPPAAVSSGCGLCPTGSASCPSGSAASASAFPAQRRMSGTIRSSSIGESAASGEAGWQPLPFGSAEPVPSAAMAACEAVMPFGCRPFWLEGRPKGDCGRVSVLHSALAEITVGGAAADAHFSQPPAVIQRLPYSAPNVHYGGSIFP